MATYYILGALYLLIIATHPLRVYSYRLSLQGYKKHFKSNVKDLNPFMVNSVVNGKLFSIKQLLMGLSVIVLLYYYQTKYQNCYSTEVFTGYIITTEIAHFMSQIVNILIFKFVLNNKNQLTGSIFMENKFVYFRSACLSLVNITPLIGLLFFIRSGYLLGAIIGFAVNIMSHLIWYKKSSN